MMCSAACLFVFSPGSLSVKSDSGFATPRTGSCANTGVASSTSSMIVFITCSSGFRTALRFRIIRGRGNLAECLADERRHVRGILHGNVVRIDGHGQVLAGAGRHVAREAFAFDNHALMQQVLRRKRSSLRMDGTGSRRPCLYVPQRAVLAENRQRVVKDGCRRLLRHEGEELDDE